ncbi:MAG: LiaF transmembrane domain-containing protein [Candidatus Saccharimonadaceae bacterium]
MKQTSIRVVTGLIIIGVGVSALLSALNLMPFWSWFGYWWPLLVITGGVLMLLGDFARNFLWGSVLLAIGSLLLLKTNGVLTFDFYGLIVPILIITGGLSLLIHTKNRSSVDTTSSDSDNIAVVLSGSDTKNKSKNYKGGKITSIFGGATLDLRDAKLTGSATLDIFALCGGIEIKVPRDWKVISKVVPLAGSVENKSEGSDSAKEPVLVLTGTATFSGVEIKT